MRYLDGIGIWGAGITDWSRAKAWLHGDIAEPETTLPIPQSSLLSPRDQRRCIATANLVLEVAGQACAMAECDPQEPASVFASAAGELDILDHICTALAAQPEQRAVSPTRFHNSVHNAPAGYWSIGSGSQQPNSSIAAGDRSFAAGLLEGCSMLDDRPVLVCAYDIPGPAGLQAVCPMSMPFGIALLLTPQRGPNSVAALDCRLLSGAQDTLMDDPRLERHRLGNPAARALPLLAQLAGGRTGSVLFSISDGTALQVEVEPYAD